MTSDAEHRIAARRKQLKTAKIVFNLKGCVVDCVLRNRSTTGAGIRLDGPAPIPEHVQLLVDGELIEARKVWQHGLNVGLAFA